MATYCDSVEFAAEILPADSALHRGFAPLRDDDSNPLVIALLGNQRSVEVAGPAFPGWTQFFLTANSTRSQCEQLVALARSGVDVADRTVCLARTGSNFRGFKGRPWSAAPGNIHLAVHFAPGRIIERFEVAFTILAAVSVVEAIDAIPGLRQPPGIRWVNDIVVGDAKLGGVLAYTQTSGRTVTSAVLGIGLNVQATPVVALTPFVPAVSSLRVLTGDSAAASLRVLLDRLLAALQHNYELLLHDGYRPLLGKYRQRSTIIGKECTICTEESDLEPIVTAVGRVIAIGDGLELRLEGCDRAITRGRLFVGRPRT